MTVVTLDSNDIPAILADAGMPLDPQPEPAKAEGAEVKPEVKVPEKAAAAQEVVEDEEDENGLTAEQKRILTKTMQHAIGKKTAKLRDAEEFAAAQYNERKLAEQRYANLEREHAALKAKNAPAVVEDAAPQKPVRANFADEGTYVDAMIQWGVDTRLAEKAEEDRQARLNRQREEGLAVSKERINRAIELVPDFEEVISTASMQVPPAIGEYLQNAELFAELAYHFAKNPDVLVSLAKLTPAQQLVKIGRIESTLTPFEPTAAQNDPKSSKQTTNGQAKPAPSADTDIDLSKPRGKAAPVITPLDASGNAGIQKDSKDMNIREAIEDFSKSKRVNLGMRKRH